MPYCDMYGAFTLYATITSIKLATDFIFSIITHL